MVIYLPVAFVKDWLCNLLRKNSSKSARSPQIVNNRGPGINSPVKHHDVQKLVEMESQVLLTKKDSDLDLSAQEEEHSLISKIRDEIDTEVLKEKRSFTAKEIATYAFYLAPIWFVTEVRFNHCSRVFLPCHVLLLMIHMVDNNMFIITCYSVDFSNYKWS